MNSLLNSLVLGTPVRAPLEQKIVTVRLTCSTCGKRSRFQTDPEQDPVVLGHRSGFCLQCKTSSDDMFFEIVPTQPA